MSSENGIDEKFKEAIESKTGAVVIIAGSNSDKPHIDKIVEALEGFKIPYEVRICSAHKQPKKAMDIIKEYDLIEGMLAYVTVAGGTDALSGTIAFHAKNIVISCPPDYPNESCLKNPPGSSNAYIRNPENVAKFIAQIFNANNKKLHSTLASNWVNKLESLENADKKLRKEYCNRQTGGN